MPVEIFTDAQWARLSAFIADNLGLAFPPQRWDELRRGFGCATRELGFDNPRACAEWLMSTPPPLESLQILAAHFTIGETYFFRDSRCFTALAERVLPDLIRARRPLRRLRIWSAGCCTGEEPYSLAILVRQLLPNVSDWKVTIVGSDINPVFLRKAEAGIYGEWSFRDAPRDLKERYFTRVQDGRYALDAEIRGMVKFSALNLATESPSAATVDVRAMDLILCRNVLMYFDPERVPRVIARFHRTMMEDGFLVVSSVETSMPQLAPFIAENFSGAIFHRKPVAGFPQYEMQLPSEGALPPLPSRASSGQKPYFRAPQFSQPSMEATQTRLYSNPRLPAAEPAPPAPLVDKDSTEALYSEGRYTEVAACLMAQAKSIELNSQTHSLLVRSLANLGQLEDALNWCNNWIEQSRTEPIAHYLQAVIFQELGMPNEARASLQRVLFLTPEFVLAHFMLGSLAHAAGRLEEASRHYANVKSLLLKVEADEPLPHGDGLVAATLSRTIDMLTRSRTT